MRLDPDEAVDILLGYVAECDYCGGAGRIQRTQRRHRADGRIRPPRVRWMPCRRCRVPVLLAAAINADVLEHPMLQVDHGVRA